MFFLVLSTYITFYSDSYFPQAAAASSKRKRYAAYGAGARGEQRPHAPQMYSVYDYTYRTRDFIMHFTSLDSNVEETGECMIRSGLCGPVPHFKWFPRRFRTREQRRGCGGAIPSTEGSTIRAPRGVRGLSQVLHPWELTDR